MAIQWYENYNGTLNFSDVTPFMELVTNEVLSFTVPGNVQNKLQAIFSFNYAANVFVGYNVSPTLPASGTITTAGRYVEFRPDKRVVNGGDVLYFITPDATAYVGVSFRQIQQGI